MPNAYLKRKKLVAGLTKKRGEGKKVEFSRWIFPCSPAESTKRGASRETTSSLASVQFYMATSCEVALNKHSRGATASRRAVSEWYLQGARNGAYGRNPVFVKLNQVAATAGQRRRSRVPEGMRGQSPALDLKVSPPRAHGVFSLSRWVSLTPPLSLSLSAILSIPLNLVFALKMHRRRTLVSVRRSCSRVPIFQLGSLCLLGSFFERIEIVSSSNSRWQQYIDIESRIVPADLSASSRDDVQQLREYSAVVRSYVLGRKTSDVLFISSHS